MCDADFALTHSCLLRLQSFRKVVCPVTSSRVLSVRYLHLNVDQVPDVNSEHRMDRAKQLPVPTNAQTIYNVLGDTTDPDPAPHHTIYQVCDPWTCVGWVSNLLLLDFGRAAAYGLLRPSGCTTGGH